MHAGEVETDAGAVRRLIRAQFPQWSDLAIEAVPSAGTDNALYRLGDDMVVRLPRLQERVEMLEKERTWLPRLAESLPLAVPAPLAKGAPGEGFPFEWSIYSWLDGEDATAARVADPERLAIELARFISALQRIDSTDGPPPGEHNVFRGEPLARRDGPTRAAIASLRDEVDSDALTGVWDAALCAPAWDRAPVWIHGDLDTRNLLVENGRLRAIIDWGCLGVGDPACDLAVAWTVVSADARATFREALAVDAATWARARGWVLTEAVLIFGYYTLETNPVLVLEGRRWLAELLAEGDVRGWLRL